MSVDEDDQGMLPKQPSRKRKADERLRSTAKRKCVNVSLFRLVKWHIARVTRIMETRKISDEYGEDIEKLLCDALALCETEGGQELLQYHLDLLERKTRGRIFAACNPLSQRCYILSSAGLGFFCFLLPV